MKKIRKATIACFYNDENQILLQERWDYSKFWEEWAFFWWWIEQWETVDEAFKRELKEELWLDMNKFDYKYLWEFIFESDKLNLKVHRCVFLIKIDLRIEELTVYEWSWAKYFSLDEAKNLKFMTDPTLFLKLIRKNILWKK